MQSASYPDHEHPQYVTKADIEALEGRLINRMAELEIRLIRDINTAFWRQILVLLAVLALLATGLFFVINSLSMQIGRLEQLAR